jgi:hypothetical protein
MLFPIFNICLGAIFLLIGFKIYKPFEKKKQEKIYKRFKYFFIIGGLGLILWGTINVFNLID